MCCVFTILVFLGPRFGILFWWLVEPTRFDLAFDQRWFLAILAWLALPWTTIMYLIVFPGGIEGFDWIWLGIGFAFDMINYFGGTYTNRQAIPGYDTTTTGNQLVAAYVPGVAAPAAAPTTPAPAPSTAPVTPPASAPPASKPEASPSSGDDKPSSSS
jgi:hypothetical protein